MNSTINIKNKRARYEYEILDKYTAGMVLKGSEIKSIRQSKASITEGYCAFEKDELYILNMHIQEYEKGGYTNHAPTRKRKLLLQRAELRKIQKKMKDVGMTIVPLRLYISEKGYAKLDIAIGRGKKLYDKREDLKQKDVKRSLDRLTR